MAAEIDGKEFGESCRFVRLCHSGWCLILVPVCRCGGDLLYFGSCRAIELLEQAVRISCMDECLQTGSGSGWGWMG